MQINGIGSNTTSGMYQNTNRKPNYEVPERDKEDSDRKQQAEIAQDNQYVQFIRSTPAKQKVEAAPELQQEELLSLGEWLKDILDRTKSFLTKIWTGGEAGGVGATSVDENMAESPVASKEVMDTENPIMSEGATLEESLDVLEAVEEVTEPTDTLWQKVKHSLENIVAYLLKLFPGSGKDTVRKHPVRENGKSGQSNIPDYMRDHPDMGRMLRDEKYFTTTYNKKGQYTSFSAPPTQDSHVIDKDL